MKSVYWIETVPVPQLAIVARPRGDDWLEDDLRMLKREGIDTLVSLLTPQEESELGLQKEAASADELGIAFLAFPIPDRTTPADAKQFLKFVSQVCARIAAGKRIGVHCRGSIGRATVLAASVLVEQGWHADAALQAIEEARGCPVPDTSEQRKWIEMFASETARRGAGTP